MVHERVWHGDFMWRRCCTHDVHVTRSLYLDTARATPLRANKTITTQQPLRPTNPPKLPGTSGGKRQDLHPWKLQRWSPSSLEHPVNKHPVFSEAPEVEFPRASAVLPGGEYLEMPPGYEAGVPHADVHGTLRGVPADGHRPFLHQILEFSALQPGYRRPRHPAHHRHLPRCPLKIGSCARWRQRQRRLRGVWDGVFFSG